MKRLLIPLFFSASLGGCVAVPYDAYSTYPPVYAQQPVYVAPQPAYVAPPVYYAAPPVFFGLGLNFYSGGHRGGWGHGGHFHH